MPRSAITMQMTVLGKPCSGIPQPRPANALTIQHVMMHGPGMHVLAKNAWLHAFQRNIG